MEEDDYRELVEIVKQRLTDYGLSDIADDHNFRVPDPDLAGVYRLPEARKHLILLLEAFEFHLKWTDKNTVAGSLHKLQRQVDKGPRNAVIEFPDVDGTRRIFLTELQDLSGLREELQELIAALKGEGFEPSPSAMEP
jgi:hypothetical protein